jgi:hypothetical protein
VPRSHSRAYYRAQRAARGLSAALALRRLCSDSCRYETRAFYDARGQVVYQPTRVCGRY